MCRAGLDRSIHRRPGGRQCRTTIETYGELQDLGRLPGRKLEMMRGGVGEVCLAGPGHESFVVCVADGPFEPRPIRSLIGVPGLMRFRLRPVQRRSMLDG